MLENHSFKSMIMVSAWVLLMPEWLSRHNFQNSLGRRFISYSDHGISRRSLLIASVAQVELRTRRSEDIVGTKIFAADSKIKSQEPFAANQGTQIAVQHLFYNIPSQTQVLKTDSIEAKHMYDEFVRRGFITPEISFSYFLQENEIFQLPPAAWSRDWSTFWQKYNEDILTLEQTEVMHISGFVGTPTLAKKSRGPTDFCQPPIY